MFEQPPPQLPLYTQLYLIVVSYSIGYITQESFSYLHIVTTSYIPSDERVAGINSNRVRDIVARFEWTDEVRKMPKKGDISLNEIKNNFDQNAPESIKKRRDRISDLMHIGTTLGPSFAVAGGILIVSSLGRLLVIEQTNSNVIGTGVGLITLSFSIFLIITSWIKSYQLARIEIEFYESSIQNENND
jgi:hypothetical protein